MRDSQESHSRSPLHPCPQATVVKECFEEAEIPEELASGALAVGAVSYRGVDEKQRLKRDILFVFDLELPESFVPTAVDGEVESFELMDLESVCRTLELEPDHPDAYKPNCALVVIDFLLRHGVVLPDAPGYLKLLASLRSGDCS